MFKDSMLMKICLKTYCGINHTLIAKSRIMISYCLIIFRFEVLLSSCLTQSFASRSQCDQSFIYHRSPSKSLERSEGRKRRGNGRKKAMFKFCYQIRNTTSRSPLSSINKKHTCGSLHSKISYPVMPALSIGLV